MNEGWTPDSFTPTKTYSQGPYVFNNWSGTVSATPRHIHFITNTSEIIEILKLATNSHESVRVIGAGHSCNDIAVTEGHMISLENYFTVLNVNRQECRVKVEAGIKIQDLNSKLDEIGLALPNQLTIEGVTLGGLISTGSHGSSDRHQILSSMVIEMELITMDGRVLTLSRSENTEIFLCALCSVGSLGVISTVTLQCVKKFALQETSTILTFPLALTSMDSFKRKNEFFKLLWYPHVDKCVAQCANKTNKVPLFQEKNRFSSLKNRMLELILFIGKIIPSFIPLINRVYFWLLHKNTTRIQNSVDILTMDCHMKQWVNEWAIPEKSVTIALTTLHEFIKKEQLKVHFPIEIRFVKGDDIPLSPSFGRDSCYIGIVMYRPYSYDVEYQKYFRGFDRIMQSFDGRPHWAKDFLVGPKDFSRMYPKWDHFWKIQSELDPNKLLWNDYIYKLHEE